MYLRPREMFEYFEVNERRTRQNEAGRQLAEFVSTGERLFGAITNLSAKEVEKWRSLRHEVTHVIIGRIKLPGIKIGDELTRRGKKYLVSQVEEIPGGWTLYYVNRRVDL